MKNKIIKNKITELAKKYQRPQSIMHFINAETLKEAYDKQPDSDMKRKYGENLDSNLEKFLKQMKKFSYFPQSKDWSQVVNADRDSEKYMLREFEDRMLQYLFREILEAIFEIQICRIMTDLKKKNLDKVFHCKFAPTVPVIMITIDVSKFLREIDQERLIDFLKQKVDDRNFIKYCKRFLQSGVKLLEECTDLENDSAVCFTSMMYCVCECYILQLMKSTMKNDFSVKIWRFNYKAIIINFKESIDLKTACCQLRHELQQIGLESVDIRPAIEFQKKRVNNHRKSKRGVAHEANETPCSSAMRFQPQLCLDCNAAKQRRISPSALLNFRRNRCFKR